MDTGKKEFIVKVDNTLADNLFENALIRDIIYCHAEHPHGHDADCEE